MRLKNYYYRLEFNKKFSHIRSKYVHTIFVRSIILIDLTNCRLTKAKAKIKINTRKQKSCDYSNYHCNSFPYENVQFVHKITFHQIQTEYDTE